MNVLGEDTDYTGGLVCATWSDANIEATGYRPDLKIYLTCYFNVDPMCWIMAHRFNGEYHYFDELCIENCTTTQAIELFYQRYATHANGVVITGDASGNNRSSKGRDALETDYTIIRNRLMALGMPQVMVDVRSKNPHVHSRVAAWNAMICDSGGVRRVKVNPLCQHLIENCENLSYVPGTSHIKEPTIKQIEQQPKLKFTKHIWDAASYLVERYDPVHLELPHHQRPQLFLRAFHPKRRY